MARAHFLAANIPFDNTLSSCHVHRSWLLCYLGASAPEVRFARQFGRAVRAEKLGSFRQKPMGVVRYLINRVGAPCPPSNPVQIGMPRWRPTQIRRFAVTETASARI